jgi:hypothetical protein
MLFLLKIAITPLLVAGVSLAARWWGPTVGGLLLGLPWMTGPVLFFLGWDKGEAFAVGACIGIELGVVCIVAFVLAYAAVSAWTRWPLSLMAGVAAFAAAAWATQSVTLLPGAATLLLPPLWAASGAAALSLLLALLLLPRPRSPALLAALPWWDIPARMLATFALVAGIMVLADVLGPELSGIVSTYPAILTVIGTFTHHRWGRDAVLRILRGLMLSLLTFVLFFLIVGFTLPGLGLIGAFALAAATAMAMTVGLFALNRGRAVR